MLPKDDWVLLSYVNTKLRDGCESVEDVAAELDADASEIVERLSAIGYRYDGESHRFCG